MAKSENTRWFVKGKGILLSHGVIAEAINPLPGSHCHNEITLDTGEIIKDVWEVPARSNIIDLMDAKRKATWGFDFEIFSKEVDEKPCRIDLDDLSKKTSPAEIKTAEFIARAKKNKVPKK